MNRIKTIKTLVFALAGVMTATGAWVGDPKRIPPGPEKDLKPLVGHVLAPRTAIDLCGTWDYARVGAIPEKYPHSRKPETLLTDWKRPTVTNFNALAWQRVTLPWAGNISQGKYYYFRKVVTLPADVATKRVLFKAEKIIDSYALIVNGKRFPDFSPLELPCSDDITSAVKPGENEIIIEVWNAFGTRNRYWNDWLIPHDWAMTGRWGVSRPVHLEIMDKIGIDDVVVQTKVTPEKVITVKATLANTTDKAVEVEVGATIEEALGGDASSVGKKEGQILSPDAGMRRPPVVIPPHGTKEVVFETKWADAKLWDPEHPNLYFADVKLYASGALGGDASSVGKKEDKIPSPDAGMRRPPIDAYRARFGFREISQKGNQFLVNGKPYIHRRTSHTSDWLEPINPHDETFKRKILTLRKAGVTGIRTFGSDWVRLAKVADEVGAFVTPVAPTGSGAAGKTDKFWKTLENYHAGMAKTFRNNPSIFAWGLANEFGTFYGGNEGGPLEKPTKEKQVRMGKLMEKNDPTRPWTYCGEVDMGFPSRGTVGPAPIRSFHYPVATCKDGITMPEGAYWYDKGELSWQRISTKDKPLVISEDIFHGTTDQHLGMAKAGGDAIYTMEGYAKTLHYIIRAFADGYYYSGLGGWETWVTYQHRGDKNLLNRLGALMPHYLVAMRENFPNLRGGETVARNVYCYNQLFTPYDCELVREDWFDGKMVFTETRRFLLDQGMKHHEKISIAAPRVKKPGKYEVRFKLMGIDCHASRSDARNDDAPTAVIARSDATKQSQLLTERTYSYTVFPPKTEIDVKGKTALLASAESVLRKMDFDCGVYASVEEVLASGARAIVIDKILSDDDGRALNDFVLAGGKVLFLEALEASWTPLMIEFRRPMSFVWRRNDDRMKDMDETWMRAWMPDHTLGDASYPKPQADTRILWDCAQKEGLSNANIFWLNRGKGAWMLCQLPVLSRFLVEPAAPHVLQAVIDEFTGDLPELKGAVVAAPDGTAGEILQALKIETRAKMPAREDVIVLDAAKGLGGDQLLAIDAHTKNKGTVVLLEPQPGENEELLTRLGLKLTAYEPFYPSWAWGGRRVCDNTPKWLIRRGNAGLLAGITNEDTFWFGTDKMYSYMMDRMCGKAATNLWWTSGQEAKPVITGKLEALPGADVELLTDPAGIAVAKLNRGKVVVVTLQFSKNVAAYPARVGRLLRTLLNNLGAATVTPERVHDYRFIDISKDMNRGLWNDPLFKKADGTFDPLGWFGTENDMRFFPVNLCGWSLTSRNYCPREPFPTEPMNLGGTKFLLQDPDKNKGRGVIVLNPGESIRLALPKDLKAQKFYFLGAQSLTDKTAALEMRLPETKEPIVFRGFTKDGCEHFGTYRWACTVKKGSVAWSGQTLMDDQASLYSWFGANPAPDKPVAWLELKNVAEKDSIAILALTAELTDK